MQPHRGPMCLVLGILSIVLCAILGPVAIGVSGKDLSAMDSGEMDPSGRGLTEAGRILGIIGSVLLVIQILVLIAMLLTRR